MPLALILPRGDQWYLLRKPLIRRDKGDTLSLLLVQILLEPWTPWAPPPASLLFPRLSGLAATEPTLSFLHCVCVFSSHSFWASSSLDVPAGVTQEERSHRISHPRAICGACLILSRKKDSAFPFPRRSWSRILCTKTPPVVGHFYFYFLDF